MRRDKLESLAEAVVAYSGYADPASPLYAARNPGGLKALGPQPDDGNGNRTFRSVIDGLQALFFDVELKVTGRSRAKLKPESTLIDLSTAYNLPILTATAWARFLRKALNDPTISAHTPLSYFTKE
jgi:hypothetical protein